jgi:hypothetical protein
MFCMRQNSGFSGLVQGEGVGGVMLEIHGLKHPPALTTEQRHALCMVVGMKSVGYAIVQHIAEDQPAPQFVLA